MFENYMNKIRQNPVPQPRFVGGLNYINNPLINKEALKNVLYNFDKYNEADVINTMRSTIEILLNEIFNKNDNEDFLKLITNRDFLSIFIKAISGVKLDYGQRIKCNKLAYDYLISENKDTEIEKLFFALSKVVNKESVMILNSIGIPEELADYISLSRYSSQKETVNVKRMNFILISCDPKLMDVQKIVLVYEKLFDHVLPLFEGIMFDYIDDDADYMNDDSWLVYSYISLAILEIVNNQPSEMILTLLRSYNASYNMLYGKVKPRFNIASISEDYNRILSCIDLLRFENIVF